MTARGCAPARGLGQARDAKRSSTRPSRDIADLGANTAIFFHEHGQFIIRAVTDGLIHEDDDGSYENCDRTAARPGDTDLDGIVDVADLLLDLLVRLAKLHADSAAMG